MGKVEIFMGRVFIQVYCKYPHGGALANFIQNLAKAILYAGYEVILLTDINREYSLSEINAGNPSLTVIPVVASSEEETGRRQKATGFCDERIGALRKYKITKEDRVLVFWIKSEFFLEKLFTLEKEAGFKTICGVLELYDTEDYKSEEKYKKDVHIEREVYLRADAILSVSEFVENYYAERGMQVYRFPPMVDSREYPVRHKAMDKYRFMIPSHKDSLQAVLKAFIALGGAVCRGIELHLCGTDEAVVREMLTEAEWEELMRFAVIHRWMKYDELIALYQQIHFMIIARAECQRTLANFPSKVPEAMTYGIVPIASDVGDYTKYYLRDGYDSIFVKGDAPAGIREALAKAISLDEGAYEVYSENAKETAETKFDYRIWAARVEEMLKNV